MDCANDESVRMVVLMWASQTTKTTVVENVLGYHVAADPSPQLMVQPGIEYAEAWSKERLDTTIRDTPVLRDLIGDRGAKGGGNTIVYKAYPGGNIAVVGANAPSGLAGRPRRCVYLDEVDRFKSSAASEGDPCSLAIRRTESFHNSVIYLTSTPTVKGASRIESEYEQTDKRKWFCPCPKCGHFQTLEWKQVKWPEGDPSAAFYECERCSSRWGDAERSQAICKGEWRPTAPFSGKRGYFLNGICSPFKAKRGFTSRLHQMASEFLEAKAGGPEQLKTWTNTFLAETWEEEGEKLELSAIASRGEAYAPDALPDDVALIVGGADVQKDRIEVEWIGVGDHDETWGIDAVQIIGDTEKPETWQRLSGECDRIFKRKDGVEMRATAIAIDIHFRPKMAREWCVRHGTRILAWPVFGIGGDQTDLVVKRFNKNWNQNTWSVATNNAKDVIFSRLKIELPGPRYCHFPRSYADEWFRQLTCEKAVTRYTKGFPKRIYEKQSGQRNEALDMRVYSLACLEILRPNIAAIRGTLKKEEKAKEPERRAALRGGGWMKL